MTHDEIVAAYALRPSVGWTKGGIIGGRRAQRLRSFELMVLPAILTFTRAG
jgi:hypothetical protein